MRSDTSKQSVNAQNSEWLKMRNVPLVKFGRKKIRKMIDSIVALMREFCVVLDE